MDIKSLWQKLDQIAESTDHKSIPESKKKKPDADGDGVPDWADKKPGKDDNKDKKKIEEEVKDEYARKVDKYLKKKYNKEEVDMKGKKCTSCKKGTYQETGIQDNMNGELHCTKCNKVVKSRQPADSKKKGVAEGRGFRGVGGAREREDDERHDLDPSDWYIVKDGKLLKASIYPRQEAQAREEGFSPTREEARSKSSNKGVAEGSDDKNPLKKEIKKLEKLAQDLSFEPSQTDPKTGTGYRPNYIKTVKKIEKLKAQLKSQKDVSEGASSIEKKIIKLYKQGLSDDEIASRLKIDSDDVKSVLDDYEWVADTTGELKGVAEDAPELKNVKHFAKPGGYGRKIDKDDESGDAFHSSDIDDTDDAPAAKSPVKRGRGRPMKGGDSETGITKKYDTDTLSSWIIGNKPKNIGKIGKVSHVHRLKEYMEMVERKTIVEGYVAEGRMSELAMIVDDIIDGRLDIYDIISGKFTPTSDLEDFVQQTLKKSYEETARDHGLHADDDGDEIIGIMYNDIHDIMSNALNKDIDEQAQPMPAQAALQQAGQQTQQTQQQLPVLAGGKPVGSAPTAQAVQAATPMVNDILNKKQALGKMGVSVTALEESLADTMNRFSSIFNESNGRRTLSESKTPKLVMEGTLEEIIAVHPHEHKMYQEGWGLDQALYQALCDYYHKEGRIPRNVWHGSSDDLRNCVEECYLQDTQPLMGEEVKEDDEQLNEFLPLAGAIAGRALVGGAGAAGRVAGSLLGRAAGNAAEDFFAGDEEDDLEEDDDNHEVAAGLGGLALGGGLGYAAGSGALDGIVGSAMGMMGLEEDDPEDDDYDYSEPLRDDGRELYPSDEDVFYPYDVDDVEEGFAGGALGGIAGAALTKSPSGALAGAKLGSGVQDSFGKKNPFENEEMDIRRHAMTRLIDELDESTYGTLKTDMSESKKPSAGMTKDEKSSLVKKAKSGKDIGKPGKGFDKLAKKAGEKYGSAEKGKKVAAAAMWKNAAPTNEGEEQLDELSKDTLKSYVKKAAPEVAHRARVDSQIASDDELTMAKTGKKTARVVGSENRTKRRVAGINKAVDKMTNEATDDDYDKAAILKGKRGRDARDDPAKAVAAAKRSPAAQDARDKLDKVRQYSNKVKESAKPDFLDKDGNKKESFKKAIVDKKKDVEESMDQPMSKILAKGYTSSQEHGDKAPRMSNKQKAASKVARDARDAADMKAFYAKSDAKKKVKENVNVAQMQAGTFRPGDKAIARDGSQVTIAKVEGNGDVWIKSWQDDKPQRVDARTLKSVGSSGKALAESYDFSEWDNQLSSLLKPTPKQAVSESAKIKKQMINESSNELSTMLQFAGLKNVQQVMEEFNASIYADDSESTSSTDGADNPPQLAMPTGMGMSQQKEDDDESTVVEPMMSDEVIGGLAKGDKESAKSDNDHLSFFEKMLSHGQSEVKTEKPKSESGEQSGIPASTSQSPVSGSSSEKPVTEDDMEEGNAFTGALAKAKSDGVQSGEKMKVGGKTYPVKEDTDVTTINPGNDDNVVAAGNQQSGEDAALAQGDSNFFSSENSSTMAENEHQGMASDSIIGDILAKLTQLVGSEQGQPAMSAEPPVMVDVQYADDEQSQDYADEESQDEEHCDQCQSCGETMYENHQCMESLNEWANSPTGESADEQFQTDMDFMTKVISGGLNNQKQDQTTLPSTRVVTRDESKDVSNTMGAMLHKLSGIN